MGVQPASGAARRTRLRVATLLSLAAPKATLRMSGTHEMFTRALLLPLATV